MSVIFYKFAHSTYYNVVEIPFGRNEIKTSDLQTEILKKEKLEAKRNDVALQIINAQTKQEYKNYDTIKSNTSVLVQRIPSYLLARKESHVSTENINPLPQQSTTTTSIEDLLGAPVFMETKDKVKSEIESLGLPLFEGTSLPQNTLTSGEDKKKDPFADAVLQDVKEEVLVQETTEKSKDIPNHLKCGLCKSLFEDAVLVTCCGSSFCDSCITSHLKKNASCPECKQECKSNMTVPNANLRKMVNEYKKTNKNSFNVVDKRGPPKRYSPPYKVSYKRDKSPSRRDYERRSSRERRYDHFRDAKKRRRSFDEYEYRSKKTKVY